MRHIINKVYSSLLVALCGLVFYSVLLFNLQLDDEMADWQLTGAHLVQSEKFQKNDIFKWYSIGYEKPDVESFIATTWDAAIFSPTIKTLDKKDILTFIEIDMDTDSSWAQLFWKSKGDRGFTEVKSHYIETFGRNPHKIVIDEDVVEIRLDPTNSEKETVAINRITLNKYIKRPN